MNNNTLKKNIKNSFSTKHNRSITLKKRFRYKSYRRNELNYSKPAWSKYNNRKRYNNNIKNFKANFNKFSWKNRKKKFIKNFRYNRKKDIYIHFSPDWKGRRRFINNYYILKRAVEAAWRRRGKPPVKKETKKFLFPKKYYVLLKNIRNKRLTYSRKKRVTYFNKVNLKLRLTKLEGLNKINKFNLKLRGKIKAIRNKTESTKRKINKLLGCDKEKLSLLRFVTTIRNLSRKVPAYAKMKLAKRREIRRKDKFIIIKNLICKFRKQPLKVELRPLSKTYKYTKKLKKLRYALSKIKRGSNRRSLLIFKKWKFKYRPPHTPYRIKKRNSWLFKYLKLKAFGSSIVDTLYTHILMLPTKAVLKYGKNVFLRDSDKKIKKEKVIPLLNYNTYKKWGFYYKQRKFRTMLYAFGTPSLNITCYNPLTDTKTGRIFLAKQLKAMVPEFNPLLDRKRKIALNRSYGIRTCTFHKFHLKKPWWYKKNYNQNLSFAAKRGRRFRWYPKKTRWGNKNLWLPRARWLKLQLRSNPAIVAIGDVLRFMYSNKKFRLGHDAKVRKLRKKTMIAIDPYRRTRRYSKFVKKSVKTPSALKNIIPRGRYARKYRKQNRRRRTRPWFKKHKSKRLWSKRWARNRKIYSVVITNSRNNYFITVTRILNRTHSTVRVFTSGQLKLTTSRKRRDLKAYNVLVTRLLRYLLKKNVTRLRQISFKIRANIRTKARLKKRHIKTVLKTLRRRKIKTSKLSLRVMRPHGPPPRAPKRRRK